MRMGIILDFLEVIIIYEIAKNGKDIKNKFTNQNTTMLLRLYV